MFITELESEVYFFVYDVPLHFSYSHIFLLYKKILIITNSVEINDNQ